MLNAFGRYPRTILALIFVLTILGSTLVIGRVTTWAMVLAPIAIFSVVVATATDRRDQAQNSEE